MSKDLIPTESRIFSDRYLRELKPLERKHVNALVFGAKSWKEAMETIYGRMRREGSPVKRAAHLGKAIDTLARLQNTSEHQALHSFVPLAIKKTKRAATLMFITFEHVERHPYNVDEKRPGLEVRVHLNHINRHGVGGMIAGALVAYICHHVVGRLHERGYKLTSNHAADMLARAGLLGYLCSTYHDKQNRDLELAFDDTLLAGTMRPSDASLRSFYDVRTAKPLKEQNGAGQRGIVNRGVVETYLTRDYDEIRPLTEQILFGPQSRSDHISESRLSVHS